jgi:hypothetical protein
MHKQEHRAARKSTGTTETVDSQGRRKQNLRALIKQWDGPTHLARKLRYSGPSYLSQLISPAKPITEKTAHYIEEQLDLAPGWMDADHEHADSALIGRVMAVVGEQLAKADAHPSTAGMAELVPLVYDDALLKGAVDPGFVSRVIILVKRWKA